MSIRWDDSRSSLITITKKHENRYLIHFYYAMDSDTCGMKRNLRLQRRRVSFLLPAARGAGREGVNVKQKTTHGDVYTVKLVTLIEREKAIK